MSRKPYEKCTRHGKTYCHHYECRREEHTDRSESSSDNAGSVSLNTEGHLSIGIGGGLAIDPTDGSLGIDLGGITVDTA